jgi:hypothetical protein
MIFCSLMNSAILTRFVFTFLSVRRIDLGRLTYCWLADLTLPRWWARIWLNKPVFDLQTFSHWLQDNELPTYYSVLIYSGLRWWARIWDASPVFDLQTFSQDWYWQTNYIDWLIDWFIDCFVMICLNRNIKDEDVIARLAFASSSHY